MGWHPVVSHRTFYFLNYMRVSNVVRTLCLVCLLPLAGRAQVADSLSLEQCIAYAIENQPLVKQAKIDEQITGYTIKSRLSDWYPRVNFNYNLQHNFEVQTNIIGGNPVKLGVDNVSALQFTLSQNIFNRDALLALRSKGDVQLQATQNTSSSKIDIAANVSKAYYDVLATAQQIRVADENIVRLEKSLRDATSQYEAGVADKTDFKRATIQLNNTRASRKSNMELLEAKKEVLKLLMGYPAEQEIKIMSDVAQMEKEVTADTLQLPDYKLRIEYRLLETQRRLQDANIRYNKWSFLPNVSLNGAYNFNYLNDRFSKLYNVNYPNSFAALSLTWPIFQGGKRNADIAVAEWQLKRTEEDIVNLKNSVNAEYAQAIAGYKGALANYQALKENLALAQEVYDVIQLQYRSGIKTYLEVITAETDLRTSQISYYNALYQLLASKVDMKKALGQINY